MNLFKNKVGRPSNETLRKRRIAKISIATIVFIVIFVSTYTLTNIRINKIKGDAYALQYRKYEGCRGKAFSKEGGGGSIGG